MSDKAPDNSVPIRTGKEGPRGVLLHDLGSMPYRSAWALQERIFADSVDRKRRRRDGETGTQTDFRHHLILCEHLPVYTLGRNGSESNLLLSRDRLAELGIDYVPINRGGDITFHGPGQLVGYPILDLDDFFTDIGRYLRSLEAVIISTLADFGLEGQRLQGATGVWLDADNPFRARKICAMGIRASRWITMHGFALNVNTDLSYFRNIIPCGIDDKGVTSLAAELGREVPLEEVKVRLLGHFLRVFDAHLHMEDAQGNTILEEADPEDREVDYGEWDDPGLKNPGLKNPGLKNQDLEASDLEASDLEDPDLEDGDLDPEELEISGSGPAAEGGAYERHKLRVDPGQRPERIDRYLVQRLEGLSRNRIQQGVDEGWVLVNGLKVKANYKVRPLDEIVLLQSEPVRHYALEPEAIPLDIRYEDEQLMVIEKPAGLVMHPAPGNFTGTLANGIAFHLGLTPEKVLGPGASGNREAPSATRTDAPEAANGNGPEHLRKEKGRKSGDGSDEGTSRLDPTRPGLVHRLDKDTSGLIVVGKTPKAVHGLARQFSERSAERSYLALAWGSFDQAKGRIEGNIGRDLRDRKKMAVFPDGNYGKHAVTHYEVLEDLLYVSLIRCRLETGRTHQIRVHMAWIGHPLFNDPTYGGDRIVKGTIFTKYKQFVQNCFSLIQRQALHAETLGFDHPETGERLRFNSQAPDDFTAALDKWRRYAAGLLRE